MTTLVVLSNKIKEVIEALPSTLGIARVDYGDVDRVTEAVQACVEPEVKRTELRTVGGRGVTRTVRIFVFIYFSYVTDPSLNREHSDQVAESVELALNLDPTLDGLVLNGLVTEVASGYSRKDGIAVRANRLTYEATMIQQLPQPQPQPQPPPVTP